MVPRPLNLIRQVSLEYKMAEYIVSVRQVRKGVQCSGSTRRGGLEGAEGIGPYNGEHAGS